MKILFLGSGYTGSVFRKLYPDSIHTSRKFVDGKGYIPFDSNIKESWSNIQRVHPEGIIISFPINSCNRQSELWEFLFGLCKNIIIIGTTSGFQKDIHTLSDNSPIDMTNPRSAAEENYRVSGASVIHASGIYGPGRSPISWLRKNLIDDSASLVNLIHVEDLTRACYYLLENFKPMRRFVLSDRTPYRWEEIIRFAVKKNYITDPGIMPGGPSTKTRIIKPDELFRMGFKLQHPDLFTELDQLEVISG